MKFALLGADVHTLRLARLANQVAEIEIVAMADVGDAASELLQLCPRAKLLPDWESLALSGEFDAIFAADDSRPYDVKFEQLRRLVAEGIDLLAVPPMQEPVDLYELEILRVEHGGRLHPYMPGLHNAGVQRLVELANETSPTALGKVSHVEFARQLSDRRESAIRKQLSADICLLRVAFAGYDCITATNPSGDSDDLSHLAVQLAETNGGYARWSISEGEESTLKVVGDQATAVLSMHDWTSPWQLQLPDSTAMVEVDTRPENELQAAIRNFADGESTSWLQVCQSAELAAASRKSLRRGRMIQLSLANQPEAEQFKSVMAAGGCLVLLLTLMGICVAAVVDSMDLPFRDAWWWRLWPVYVFFPVVMFVLLQILQRVIKEEE